MLTLKELFVVLVLAAAMAIVYAYLPLVALLRLAELAQFQVSVDANKAGVIGLSLSVLFWFALIRRVVVDR